MPFDVVDKFEQTIAEYAGAPYGVAVDSCTNALFLSLMYRKIKGKEVTIPSKTYISVPCSIVHAGGLVKFSNNAWSGCYELEPFKIYDSAKRFKEGMFIKNSLYCLSFHIKKHIPIGRGGMILTDDINARDWLRLARYNGRLPQPYTNEGVFKMVGWNFYMPPESAARGLWLFNTTATRNTEDLPEDYPDLSKYQFNDSGSELTQQTG
jgi:dTDP-4-amino-4,6-dideoxygalactose transaminase